MTGFKVTNLFFDRAVVMEAIDAATRKSMAKAGAFVRTRARSSMRRRKDPAPPGKPPSVHEGSLKNKLYFSYDTASRSVVIGPARYKAGTAPNALEFGGKAKIQRRGVTKTVNIEARPYMGPALAAEVRAGSIPSAWADSLVR